MKFAFMFIWQYLFIFQNPLEDEANYKTNRKSKRSFFNGWLIKSIIPKNYKMPNDSIYSIQNIFYKKRDTSRQKGLNYKMPNN